MSEQDVKVKIFGSEYNLRGENTDTIHRMADYVDRMMNKINTETPHQTEETIAVISSLNIAEDFFEARDANRKLDKEFATFADECSDRVDEILKYIDDNLKL